MFKTANKNYFFLISLFLFAFLIRSLVFCFYLGENRNYWQVDSNTYHKIAVSIDKGDGVTVDEKSNFYRLPGYSFFLSIYYKLFGVNTKNVLWVQIFLASFIPIFTFFLSLVLFPTNLLLAKVVGFYSSIHLGLVLYSGFFMTESLFILFFLLFSILFFSSFHFFFCHKKNQKNDFNLGAQPCPDYMCSGPSFVELCNDIETWQENKYKRFNLYKLFFAGIFLGISSLIRPVGHYLIFLSVLILFFSRDLWLDKIKKTTVVFCGWVLIVFGWLLRNWLLTGYIFFHTLPGGHFLYFSAARSAMYEQNCSYNQAKDFLRKKISHLADQKVITFKKKLNEPEYCNLRMNLAIKYFRKYPFITAKNWMTDILRTSLSLYSAELLYLENGRKEFDYFSNKRTVLGMFARYLFPKTKSTFLKLIVLCEILTLLCWSFYILCIPGFHGKTIVNVPFKFFTDKILMYPEVYIWISAL
ncbi:hypothetical protein ACFLYH_01290, partial [Candidatus Dependentiae bacterium]